MVKENCTWQFDNCHFGFQRSSTQTRPTHLHIAEKLSDRRFLIEGSNEPVPVHPTRISCLLPEEYFSFCNRLRRTKKTGSRHHAGANIIQPMCESLRGIRGRNSLMPFIWLDKTAVKKFHQTGGATQGDVCCRVLQIQIISLNTSHPLTKSVLC